MSLDQDIRALAPGDLVELFVLDATALGGDLLRFHNGTNGLRQPVVWQGETYNPFPIEATGFEFSGKGQLPRPSLKVANITGALGAVVRTYGDLLGAKLTRKRTLAKYLDAVNFPAQRNLLTYTDALGTAPWALTGVTMSGSTLAWDGTPTAQGMIEGTTASQRYSQYNLSPGGTAGTAYPLSAFAKQNGAKRYLSLLYRKFGAYATPATPPGAVFDLSTGECTFTQGGATGYVVRHANGMMRCVMVPPVATDTGQLRAVVGIGNVSNTLTPTYTGDGTSGVWVSGAQIDTGTLTDYQPIGAAFNRNPTADPTAALPDDVFFVDRKANENKVLIEFELAAAFDVAGVQLPRRPITQNVCVWKYRTNNQASGCSYTGTAYFDANDAPVGSAGLDVCGKRLSSCKARHGTAPLPFGGFPGAGLSR